MAVNPGEGTGHSVEDAAQAIEGLFSQQEAVEDAQEVAEETVDETVEEAEETEEIAAEADDDEAEPEEVEETVEATIESLSDVAEALEVPLDELLANLQHTVKVDGETLNVSLSELQAGYQKDADYRQKTEALKRDREAWESEINSRYQALEQEHAQNAYVLNTIEQQLMSDFNSDELARLRHENPQEWSARRMEQQERLAGLERLKQDAASRLTQMREQLQQQQAQKLAETVRKESELLQAAIPSWGRETQQQVNDYLLGKGWTPDQLNQVYDHRLVEMAHKAMLYERGQQKAQKTVKQVKKAPKLVKPSKPQTAVSVKSNNLRKLKAQLKNTGHIDDAAKLIEQMI